jgi:small redox-active disulfide protein 2
MLMIKVLGPGCANCERMEQIARKIVGDLGVEAQIEKITDMNQIIEYGVMTTPGLMVDDELVVSGRVPTEAEMAVWIVDGMAAQSP